MTTQESTRGRRSTATSLTEKPLHKFGRIESFQVFRLFAPAQVIGGKSRLGAKRIGRAEMDAASFLPGARAELRGGRGLAAAVHADEENHLGLVLDRQGRRDADELHHFLPQENLGLFRRAR